MQHGILIAILVSIVWIILQNLWMFVRPAENRMAAMFLGYFASLPFVWLAYRFVPAPVAGTEAPALGYLQAYLLHLLLFFCYGECFYHVERSVTLRLFTELLKHGETGAPLTAIQDRYSVDEMIQRRLEVLRDRGFLVNHNEAWQLTLKGKLLARTAACAAWVLQSKSQAERS